MTKPQEDQWLTNASEQHSVFSEAEVAFIAEAKRRAAEDRAKQATCDHAGYSFEKMGRCCFECGAFMVDWGD